MGKNDARHTLTHNSVPKVLEKAPTGYNEQKITYERSKDYHSVLRSEASTLRYDKLDFNDPAGYQFLVDAATDPREEIFLDIERLNVFTNDYELAYSSILDLTPTGGFKKVIGEYVEAKSNDVSILSKFKARDDLSVNVFENTSIDGETSDDTITPELVNYLPIDIYLALISNGGFQTGVYIGSPHVFGYKGIATLNEMGDRITIEESPTSPTIYENNLDEDVELININVSGEYTIELSHIPEGFESAIARIIIFVYDSGGVVIDTKIYPVFQGYGAGVFNNTYSINEPSIPIQSGGYLQFLMTFNQNEGLSGTLNWTVTQNDIHDLSFSEKTDGHPTNQIKSLFLHDAFRRNLYAITNNNNLYAPVLGHADIVDTNYTTTGEYALETFTNGFQLRQFTDRALNSNFKDLFKSLDSIRPVGYWYDIINEQHYIDDIEKFYKTELMPFTITEISDLTETFSKDLYFNQILSGYPKIDYEDFSGVNEVNAQTEHSENFPVKKKLNIRSVYSCDSVGPELARRFNISTEASKDTKYDDTNYINRVNSSTNPTTVQGGTDLSGFEGIEQSYNLDKTPRENLIRQGQIYGASILGNPLDSILFTKSNKDTNIEYRNQNGDLVNEFDNIQQTELPTALIYPIEIKFKAPVTIEMINETKSDPHRAYPYLNPVSNEIEYGYINIFTYNPFTFEGEFTLIKANLDR